jgi:flavin reductase (DIM6/NTAB) family NADH-FMN oxidoreductase RutF
MKTTFGPQRILFPSPVALVVTGDMDNANIVTIAWVSLLTSVPPSLGISVGTKGVSGEAIKKNKEFTVNIASVDILTEADYCGISSGRDIDKFAETGLTKMPSKVVKAPIIRECPLNLECRLVSATMVGRTNHFIGEI